MKKTRVFMATGLLFLAGMMFSACNTSADVAYQCPMKCEGEKTYSEPGQCPVCEMDLKTTAEVEKLQKEVE